MTALVDTTAIRARADAATAGPWVHADDTLRADGLVQSGNVLAVGVLGLDPWQVAAAWAGSIPSSEGADLQTCSNAEFIAHAREDVPALLDDLDRLAAENRIRREAVKNAPHDWFNCTTDDPYGEPQRGCTCWKADALTKIGETDHDHEG